MRTVWKSATFLATESVNSAPFKRGKTEVQIFWQGKAQNSSPLLRCTFLARRSAKLIANFSATMVSSLPSFSLSLYLSLSLSLSPNVPHAQYRKRFRASYTVKPALSDHPTVQEKVVVIDRWSLKQGSLNSGRFSEVLFNIGELRGTHAYDLRNDKSHRPGASGDLVWWFSCKLALWRLFFKENVGSKQRFFLLLVA